MSCSKSAAIPDGSAMRPTVPSSAVAISRTSLTTHRSPTPRASHWKLPWTARIARCRLPSGSDSFLPSVSRIACLRTPPGRVANVWLASMSQELIAVPPEACTRAIARFASSRARGSIRTIATGAFG